MKSFTSNIEDLQRVELGEYGDDDGGFLPPDEDVHVIPINEPPPGGGGGPGGTPTPPGEPGDDEGGGGGPGGTPTPPGDPGDDEGGDGGTPGGPPSGPGRGPGGKPGGKGGIPVIDIIPGGTDTSGINQLPGSNDKNEGPIKREDLKDALTQAEQQEATENKGGKGPAGKGKGGGGRVAVTTDFPTHTDWARLLVNLLNKTKVGPPSWAKPHKRTFGSKMGGFPIMVPGRDTEKDIGSIIIAIDTSGSISDTLVGLFLSDLKKLFDTFKTSRNFRCKVIMWHSGPYAESRDYTVKEFKDLYNWVMSVFKQGGTAIDPVVKLIKALPNLRDYIGTIWFTDGQIDDLQTKLPDNYNIFVINGYVADYTREFLEALKKYKPSKPVTIVKSAYDDE